MVKVPWSYLLPGLMALFASLLWELCPFGHGSYDALSTSPFLPSSWNRAQR